MSSAIVYRFMRMAKERLSRALPPGQHEIDRLQVLHVGITPKFEETWKFEVCGLVKNPFILNYEQFKALPKVMTTSDFHCVTGWSKLDNKWGGVPLNEIVKIANVSDNARFATIECENDYTTTLTINDMLRPDVILAYSLDDEELPAKYGGPLRIIVPHKYGYKSGKWVRKIKFTQEEELGYWEARGYSITADVSSDDRYSPSRGR